jgi:transcriptional regulator with XRE-family HTH domain
VFLWVSKLLYFPLDVEGEVPALPPLKLVGSVIQGARLKLGLTQQRAAKLAGVSRKQWALLEKGENVSVVFLLKVMRALGLTQCPIADDLEVTSSPRGGIDADEVLRLAAELTLLGERLERLAFDAVLPPSERAGEAAAIDAYLRGSDDLPPAAQARLKETLHRVASDSPAVPPQSRPATRTRKREPAERKRRA